ncbi:MAG: aldo/keto reductase [Lachnospiraceae bacterium]|nr:aldo/keto reductase [Lachnospiraceae bacterium]
MIYQKLGKTNLTVSKIGFGGIPIMTGHESIFLARLKGSLYTESLETIRYAFGKGINFYDTAIDYRDSEKIIGEALCNVRKEVILATKSKALSYDKMINDITSSLKNLQTDYIDLFQLHYVKNSNALEQIMNPENGAFKALLEKKEEGAIRFIGLASHNPFVFKEAIDANLFDTIQLPLNLLEHECNHIIEIAKNNNVGTIAMKPYAGGALTNSLVKLTELGLSNQELKEIALSYVYSTDVSITIPGMGTKSEVDENIQILLNKMNNKKYPLELINSIIKKVGKTFCRRCQYCEPCPNNISISAILRIIKYYEDYDLPDWAKEQYKEIEKNYLNCSRCYICESKCPYDLKIVNELERIHNIISK